VVRFPPTRDAALARLAHFAPRAGAGYEKNRNVDPGPDRPAHVSGLSPWLRHRILREDEVLAAIRSRHGTEAAQKFIQEVFWRSYWKGWLQMRPVVWDSYRADLRHWLDAVQTQSGLRAGWEAACKGETGIDGFDHWAHDLVHTGWLHNHARMSFASIWVHTLRLPWEMGADFFLRHLIDGDASSNTLSWRWVAGLQTRGKAYLASTDAIEACSDGRFAPRGLAREAVPVVEEVVPDLVPLPMTLPFDPALPTALLLTDDDMDPRFLIYAGLNPVATATLDATAGLSPLMPAGQVAAFKRAAFGDMQTRFEAALGPVTQGLSSPQALDAWLSRTGAAQLVMPFVPVGPGADLLAHWSPAVPVIRVMRAYDAAAWPHATHGFFRFRGQIPALLRQIPG